MKRTCAVCVALSDDCKLEPLGRDDALVPVCASCRGEGVPDPAQPRRKHPSLPLIPAGHSVFRVRRDRRNLTLDRDGAVARAMERNTDATLLGENARWYFFVFPDANAPDYARRIVERANGDREAA